MASWLHSTPALLGVSIGTRFTVSATTNVVGNLKEVILNNVNAAARTVRLYLVPVSGSIADSNAIMKDVSIGADTYVRIPFDTYLEAGATLQALASAADSIMLRSSWIEFGPTPVPLMKPQTPGLLQTSANTYGTVTTGKEADIREVILSNVTGTDRTATLHFVPNGGSVADSNMILDAVTIAANTMVRFPFNTALEAGGTIRALASLNDAISIRTSLIEY